MQGFKKKQECRPVVDEYGTPIAEQPSTIATKLVILNSSVSAPLWYCTHS